MHTQSPFMIGPGGQERFRANGGFTLLEIAVLIAVFAVLTAILTPLVVAYINESRSTRAVSDARAIAQAVQIYRRDTGQYPIYENPVDAANDTESVAELVSGGTLPAARGLNWSLDPTGDFATFLNSNLLGLPTDNGGSGTLAFRGPYMEGIGADPWGRAYVVTAVNLRRASLNIGFVISAGPDGVIDTNRDQTGALAVGNDDIVIRIK